MSESELLEEFVNNVPADILINEVESISQYYNVSNFAIASAEIESMTDVIEKHEQRI